MCKILTMVGIQNPTKAIDFYKASVPFMSGHDNHGAGYSAIDSNGKMFSERWLHPVDSFQKQKEPEPIKPNVLKEKYGNLFDKFKEEPIVSQKDVYSSHGDINFEDVRTITYHTRFATCSKEFKNVHPFIIGETSLIHNGMIRNSEDLTQTISTCDSESILHEYINNTVNVNPENVQAAINKLKGYWAVNVLSLDQDGNRILDFFRNGASIYATYLEEAGCLVMCTTEKILKDTYNALGWECKNEIKLVKEDCFVRFNPITGDIIHTHDVNDSILNVTTSYVKKPITSIVGNTQSNISEIDKNTVTYQNVDTYDGASETLKFYDQLMCEYDSNFDESSDSKYPTRNTHKFDGDLLNIYNQLSDVQQREIDEAEEEYALVMLKHLQTKKGG